MPMTKKILASLCLVLFAALNASAQEPTDWVKFSPPGSRFNVLVPPGEPKKEVKTARNANGPYTLSLFAFITPEGEVYIVGWVEYHGKVNFDAQVELDTNRDTFIKSFNAELLSTTPIQLGEHPGIEFKAARAGQLNLVARFYIVDRRPHILLMVAPVGRDTSADRERFFSSFKLVPAK
jgi:hypothetical protein